MMPDSQFNENWGAQLSAEVWYQWYLTNMIQSEIDLKTEIVPTQLLRTTQYW
jgi:hypothetical protein